MMRVQYSLNELCTDGRFDALECRIGNEVGDGLIDWMMVDVEVKAELLEVVWSNDSFQVRLGR